MRHHVLVQSRMAAVVLTEGCRERNVGQYLDASSRVKPCTALRVAHDYTQAIAGYQADLPV